MHCLILAVSERNQVYAESQTGWVVTSVNVTDMRTYIGLPGMSCGFVNGKKRHFVANSYQHEKSLLFQKLRSGNGKETGEVNFLGTMTKSAHVNTYPFLYADEALEGRISSTYRGQGAHYIIPLPGWSLLLRVKKM